MKINLYEDEINGEVQDGSVDLETEFQDLLTKIRRSLDRYPRLVLPAHIFGDEIERAAIEFTFDKEDKVLKWYLKGYFKEETGQQINFVIPRDVIANGAKYLVDHIKTNFPELLSYPKEILDQYQIKAHDFDIYTRDGMIAGQYFMRTTDRHNYKEAFDAQYPLVSYLENIDTIAQTYVLPYEFKFAENYPTRYYYHLNKARKFGTAYQSGTFEGHTYKFKYFRVHISPQYRSFNTETLTLESNFHLSVDYSLGIIIDGEDYTDEIHAAPLFDDTGYPKAYRKEVIEKLKPIFKSHGLEVS